MSAVGVLAVRWVAELAVHPNGMHEIRAGAVNARERPLVAFAASYELAKAIADAHNRSAAVAELIETLGYCEAWFAKFSPTAPLINDQGVALHPMLDCIRAALARCKGGAV